jgi:F-type H+-transporting ATPase subunit delta
MEEITAARHYARALFAICRDRGHVDRMAAELEQVLEHTRDASEAGPLLGNPEIPLEAKRRILQLILPAETSGETRAFLSLLMQHRQLHLLADVHRAFLDLRHESFGVLKARVETAHPLTPASQQQLREALVAATGRDVFLAEELCPELIGGVRVQVGDRIIDGSIAGRLKQIQEQVGSRA